MATKRARKSGKKVKDLRAKRLSKRTEKRVKGGASDTPDIVVGAGPGAPGGHVK